MKAIFYMTSLPYCYPRIRFFVTG